MSEQAFPLDGFNTLESDVRSITQQARPKEQKKPQEEQRPEETSVIKRVKDIRLVFLPNRINTTENRADEMKQREETVKILGRIGKVTPRIKQSVVIKRYSTVSPLDKYQKAAVEHAFDAIVEQINV